MSADIARRLVEFEQFVAALPHGSLPSPLVYFGPWFRDDNSGIKWLWSEDRWLPDLTDWPTAGALLGLLLHPHTLRSPSGEPPGHGGQLWCILHRVGDRWSAVHGECLGEVVALALIELWESQ
jgi:hypothetical protein